MGALTKVSKSKAEAMTLPVAINNAEVFSARALSIISAKEKEKEKVETIETALAMKIERLKAQIAKTDEAKELARLTAQYKRAQTITKDLRRSIAVTMEDDLHEVPGKHLHDKIQYIASQREV